MHTPKAAKAIQGLRNIFGLPDDTPLCWYFSTLCRRRDKNFDVFQWYDPHSMPARNANDERLVVEVDKFTITGSGSLSITFAPLPTMEPGKRSGAHPLGVAARSRLLRHRREQGLHPDVVPYRYPYSEQDQEQGGHGVHGELGLMDDGEELREAEAGVDADEDARTRAVGGQGRGSRGKTMSDPGEGDVLVSLGRLGKGAEWSLWRSISMKERGSPPKTEVHMFDDPDARSPSVEESLKKLLAGPQAAPATAAKTSLEQRAPRTSIEPVANV
ncbi:hypothetical protein FKP32DRAFT_1600069 [Trametes sanguinea]|nr:hypothetical protein FKP32DRAFT_1600069 [Trametes sanguinea]